MNKVILIGNLGKDPETKYLESGKQLSNFSIATSETYKNQSGEKVTDTEWHNITAFGKLSEIADKHFTKGMKVLVEGKIKTRSWEKDGEKKYATDIIMNSFEFLGGNEKQTQHKKEEKVNLDYDNDDLPFV